MTKNQIFWFLGLKSSHIGDITIRENYFYMDGRIWFYKGLTSFLLLKRFLTGRKDDALRFMDWGAGLGANTLRVFSQVDWTGPPEKGVEVGFYAKDFLNYDEVAHDMFEEAANRGLCIELVAHTYAYNLDSMLLHSRRIDAIVASHNNGFFEDANEPPVNNIPLEQIAAFFTPKSRRASSGQYDPTPYPGRTYGNDHPPRDNEFSRKFKGGWEVWTGEGPWQPFSPPWRKPWVLDEPKRFDDDASLDEWKSFGAGAKFFCAGVTGHSIELQKCNILTGAPLERLQAMYEGCDSVPSQRYYGYEHPDDNGSLRRYRRKGEDGKTYEISVKPFEFFEVK